MHSRARQVRQADLTAMHWLCRTIWFMRLASSLSSSRFRAAASLMAASAAARARSSPVDSPPFSLSLSICIHYDRLALVVLGHAKCGAPSHVNTLVFMCPWLKCAQEC